MPVSEFNERQQQELLDSDADAWRAVCGVLLTIVSVGVCIALIALYFIV